LVIGIDRRQCSVEGTGCGEISRVVGIALAWR
jgi:hypothetical protein